MSQMVVAADDDICIPVREKIKWKIQQQQKKCRNCAGQDLVII